MKKWHDSYRWDCGWLHPAPKAACNLHTISSFSERSPKTATKTRTLINSRTFAHGLVYQPISWWIIILIRFTCQVSRSVCHKIHCHRRMLAIRDIPFPQNPSTESCSQFCFIYNRHSEKSLKWHYSELLHWMHACACGVKFSCCLAPWYTQGSVHGTRVCRKSK